MIIRPFDKPESQFTQLHNTIFDVIMRECTPNEWQVLCAIIRKTRGWDKAEDDISYSQIIELTGIVSRTTISKSLQGLIQKNMIAAVGRTGVTKHYILNTDYTIDLTSPENGLVDDRKGNQSRKWTGTSPENGLPTSPENGHTKDIKSLNKRNIKDGSHFLKELIRHHSLDQTPTERKVVAMLKRCRPDYGGNGVFTLRTPEPDDCAWMTDRLTAILQQDLTGITGKKISVKFKVLEKKG